MFAGDQGFVLEPEAIKLLEDFHIPYPEHSLAQDADEASRIADGLGYPVVLKIVSPDVIHKSDVGGVQIDLSDAASVQQAYRQMIDRILSKTPHARINGALVCRQASPGLEVIVGALKDLTFGPTIMFGLGGVFTEVFKDVSFRLAPLRYKDAVDMIHEIRSYPLLTGFRGEAAYDTQALIDLLLKLSHLVSDYPEIEELDLNPVRVYEHGLMALDIRLVTNQ